MVDIIIEIITNLSDFKVKVPSVVLITGLLFLIQSF